MKVQPTDYPLDFRLWRHLGLEDTRLFGSLIASQFVAYLDKGPVQDGRHKSDIFSRWSSLEF